MSGDGGNTLLVDLKYTPEPGSRIQALGPNRTRWQPWSVIIVSGDNQEPLFQSTEHYTNRGDALHAIDLGFGPNANVYRREPERGDVPLRLAAWFSA